MMKRISSDGGLTWANGKAKLGALKPWSNNPRMSTKAQAKRLLESWQSFGQVETIAVGPALDVYNGHQRLSALLTVYGPDYEVDTRQASRALTEDERKRLTIMLHAGAVGSWDWDSLSSWDAPKLAEWGMDQETLDGWRRDTAALTQMVESEQPAPEFAEYDESVADDVEMLTCPSCGATFPK